MKFTVLTLFPEMFPGMLGHSLAGKALENGLWALKTIDVKEYGIGKFKHVDDAPYGGGAGMVIRPDVLEKAIEENLTAEQQKKIIYMSPRGKVLDQSIASELSKKDEIIIICGRYEGIDERVIEHYNIEEVSVGDYILSGGEPAAMILMDAVVRLLPEVVGNFDTHSEESFSNNLLEYPHYTRPAEWKDKKVPEILSSGDHKKVADWRKQQSLEITKKRRPDLL